MADFSNAKIMPAPNRKPMSAQYYMGLGYTGYLYSSDGSNLSQYGRKDIILDTPTKISISYSGAFRTNISGTQNEFYIHGYGAGGMWRVYNVTFTGGDPYLFTIDIEISGNST